MLQTFHNHIMKICWKFMVSRKTFESALLYFQIFLAKIDRRKFDFNRLDLVACICVRIAARMYECQCHSRQGLQKKQVWLPTVKISFFCLQNARYVYWCIIFLCLLSIKKIEAKIRFSRLLFSKIIEKRLQRFRME